MSCAVVELLNGEVTHHTNIVSGSLRMTRNDSSARLVDTMGGIHIVGGALSVRIEDDMYATEQFIGRAFNQNAVEEK